MSACMQTNKCKPTLKEVYYRFNMANRNASCIFTAIFHLGFTIDICMATLSLKIKAQKRVGVSYFCHPINFATKLYP